MNVEPTPGSLSRDSPPHARSEFATDGESQTAAAMATGLPILHLDEGLEDAFAAQGRSPGRPSPDPVSW